MEVTAPTPALPAETAWARAARVRSCAAMRASASVYLAPNVAESTRSAAEVTASSTLASETEARSGASHASRNAVRAALIRGAYRSSRCGPLASGAVLSRDWKCLRPRSAFSSSADTWISWR